MTHSTSTSAGNAVPFAHAVESRVLLRRLRDALGRTSAGQERLDRITQIVARGLAAEVCSIYLRRGAELELSATTGLNPAAVHQTRMRLREGLVGRIAYTAEPVNTKDAPSARGFQYFPETGEEIYRSFLGVPIQRLGEVMGVLVVQNALPRDYTEDEIHGLEVVAMVIAEMAETGAFASPADTGLPPQPHALPYFVKGVVGQEGVAEGEVLLHDPRVVVSNPVADDPAAERARLHAALEGLRGEIDGMLEADYLAEQGDHHEVLKAWRMFADDKGWVRRMEASIDAGLAAEAAVDREQSETRARMARIADPYIRERLHDLDDLSNRLLRKLTGQRSAAEHMPENPVLVARNIGPGELLDYGRKLKGVVLEEGSVGNHAAIVARALAIPLVIQARRITREALPGDRILVDGDQGVVHLRPEDNVATAFRAKIDMAAEAQEAYAALRDEPATSRDGVRIEMLMNAGLIADLPSLNPSGAEGVGLFRTELQFLVRPNVPKRSDLAKLYARVLDAAGDKPVTFRTLDIGSDKVLPYMKREPEPNPALGWRAIRVGLDRVGVMRMQIQALIRAANGRPLSIMFPFVAQFDEFRAGREHVLHVLGREAALGRPVPVHVEIGAMLETPSLAFAPDQFFQMADFISIGGNDLKQFFFAADRENERVRRRYDTLNVSFLTFIEQIATRCERLGTPVSFCGEDAGRPVEALAFAAMGLRKLSMRPASIGPVKRLIRAIDLGEAKRVIDVARGSGAQSVRAALVAWLEEIDAPFR